LISPGSFLTYEIFFSYLFCLYILLMYETLLLLLCKDDRRRCAAFRSVLHPGGMRRPVEPPITILCIPAGLHPLMNLLARFAAHQPTMDGMHSAGMQPEVCGRFFYQAMHPSGMPLCRGFFVGLSLVGQ
jgi:hypothetical protein